MVPEEQALLEWLARRAREVQERLERQVRRVQQELRAERRERQPGELPARELPVRPVELGLLPPVRGRAVLSGKAPG